MDNQASLQAQVSVATDRLHALAFLSDLSNLFERPSPTLAKKRPSHVLHKLTFYAAQVATCPTGALRTLAEELHHQAAYLELEATETGGTEIVPEEELTLPLGPAAREIDMGVASGSEPTQRRSRHTIEELN
jgi:hypothetical protein